MKHKNKSKKIVFDPEINEEEKTEVAVDDQIKKKKKKPKNQELARKEKNSENAISSSVGDDVQNNFGEGVHKEELENVTNLKKNDESKRSRKRKKHMELQVENKVKKDVSHQECSLNYLSKWKHSRNDWKFEKNRQAWLKQNMFNIDKVPEQFWEILVEYFSNAKGNIRKMMVNDAIKVMEAHENDEDSSNVIIDRARQVIQCLQDS